MHQGAKKEKRGNLFALPLPGDNRLPCSEMSPYPPDKGRFFMGKVRIFGV